MVCKYFAVDDAVTLYRAQFGLRWTVELDGCGECDRVVRADWLMIQCSEIMVIDVRRNRKSPQIFQGVLDHHARLAGHKTQRFAIEISIARAAIDDLLRELNGGFLHLYLPRNRIDN